MDNPDWTGNSVIAKPAYAELPLADKLRRWYTLSGDRELKEAADALDAQHQQIERLQAKLEWIKDVVCYAIDNTQQERKPSDEA